MNSNFSPKQINSNIFFSNSFSKTIINSSNFSQENQIKQNIFSKKTGKLYERNVKIGEML